MYCTVLKIASQGYRVLVGRQFSSAVKKEILYPDFVGLILCPTTYFLGVLDKFFRLPVLHSSYFPEWGF